MSLGDVSLACAWALVDELVASGMRHACLSPGSRSTPLALALARHPGIELYVHLDERSSAFFALGIAKSTLRPVAVACTSGTAAAELFPAVIEASQSRMPLVLLTADRPPRLRGTGANQTIDQVGLYGPYTRAYLEPSVPSEFGDVDAWHETGRHAVDAMLSLPGPVHVNCAFDEPLGPSDVASPFQTSGEKRRGARPGATPTPKEVDSLVDLVSGARGVALFGGWPTIDDDHARFWSEALGWPVIAEPTSGARRPGVALAAGQALLGSRWLDDHRPDVVVQFGAAPTTRTSQALVAATPELAVVDRFHLEPDVESRATLRLHLDPGELSFGDRHLIQRLPDGGEAVTRAVPDRRQPDPAPQLGRGYRPAPTDWTGAWRRADHLALTAMDNFLDGVDQPFEARVARDLTAWIPEGGTLFVGNSSPVRDLDLAMAPRDGLRVLANRGASGIDGLISTALGIAAADRGPTFTLLGDLSLVHDAGALLWSSRRGIDLTVVVLNNGGGELFAQLPQQALAEHEQLFLTPHGLDLSAICTAAGADHERVDRSRDLIPALARATTNGGVTIVEVVVDVELQRRRLAELSSAIDAALSAAG